MKVTKTVETLYCDICKTEQSVKTFCFEYWGHDGDHAAVLCHETHLCVNCQKRVLTFIALESGGAFKWRQS